MNLQIKYASIDEINIMMDWAAAEGWNPGIEDSKSYYLIDPRGFYVGYLGDKLIACASRVQYSPDFSFLGFFIVHPEYRFKRAGYEIAQAIKNHILKEHPQQNLALDGVVNRISKYEKMGFKVAHSNFRYMLAENNFKVIQNPKLFPIRAISLDTIAEYDKPFFPANRFSFLMSWLTQPQTQAFAYYDNGLLGFGAIRPAQTGYRMGPLFANNSEIAMQLLQQLCSSVERGHPVFIDVPGCNKSAIQMCEELNMQPMFETGRMYLHTIPDIALDRIYGLTSLEVG